MGKPRRANPKWLRSYCLLNNFFLLFLLGGGGGSQYVAPAGLELTIFLGKLPKCWDYTACQHDWFLIASSGELGRQEQHGPLGLEGKAGLICALGHGLSAWHAAHATNMSK